MQRAALMASMALTVLVAAPAWAETPAVTQKTDKGEVNWSQKTITVTGSGTFSNSSGNAAQARLTATKAAKMDAQRNLLEIIKGVQVQSGTSAGKLISTNEIRNKVEGVVKNFEVVDTKYFADGGVDVIIRVPIDGALTDALVPDAGSKAAADAKVDPGHSAVIIDASGLGVEPALAPRLLDDAGKEVFSAALVSKDTIKDTGVCGSAKSLDAAKSDKRAGGKPLVLKAQKRAQGSKNDIVLSAKDAAQLQGAGYLSEGKLVIVVD